jgi:hypothetical protein
MPPLKNGFHEKRCGIGRDVGFSKVMPMDSENTLYQGMSLRGATLNPSLRVASSQSYR